MTGCIDPTELQAGELIVYVEGEADERVRDHVNRCPECARKAAQLRQTSQAMLNLMYRADCPAPEVLARHQLDLLSPGEQLIVAAHARTCLHCTRELGELGADEDSLSQMVLQVLRRAVRVVEGASVPAPRSALHGVRGAESPQHAFRGAGLDVLIGFQPTAASRARGRLVGSVLQVEAVTDGQAWLFQEGEKPRSSPVDELGTFTFEEISRGEYDLALEVGEEALVLREVAVG